MADSKSKETNNAPERPVLMVVAMASSAGGLKALTSVLTRLRSDFPAPIVIVQHLDPKHRSLMAEILNRKTSIRVREARVGDKLTPGVAFIAPQDQHLLVNSDGSLSLTHTELVNFVRPSATLLFESVAASYKERAIAVVLTGSGSDGSLGVRAIKQMGGTVIVQNQATSEFFGMPMAAIETGCADFILSLDEIPMMLERLVTTGAEDEQPGD